MNKAVQKPAKILELKGSTLTVLTMLVRSADVAVLTKALDDITGGAPDFFEYDAAVIDFSPAEDLPETPPDWQDVRWIFTQHRLNLFAVRAAPAAWMTRTLAAGLTWIAEGEAVKDAEKSAKKNKPVKQPVKAAQPQEDEPPQPVTAPVDPGAKAVVPVKRAERPQKDQTPPAAARSPASIKTMMLDKPLRSGQRVYASGDLIVTAAVHPGSEVIADGNIHVYAPLRGRALAGARGDESARILSICFEAELVSIAGVYLTFEPGTPADVFGKAAQVKLEPSDADGKTKLRVLPLAG